MVCSILAVGLSLDCVVVFVHSKYDQLGIGVIEHTEREAKAANEKSIQCVRP